ncbi:MAG: hypothetical protein HYZ85_03085 [Candidatus Omnitrophica bacterium]|nr:hypothetical protein [Candidatus Omnitrophota bacterium]
MKVFNVFAQIFTIFAYLTLGSLLIIVSIHLVSLEDLLIKIRELYESPMQSMQTGLLGLLFITVGLAFTKLLVKKGRDAEALIFHSEIGPVVVSVIAMEDVAKKVLKRIHLVKDWKIKTLIDGKDVEMRVRLTLWAGSNVQELLNEVQAELYQRLKKLLGEDNKLQVICDVQKIEDHEFVSPSDEKQAVTL